MSDFYCYHDLSDDLECSEQCARCCQISTVTAEGSNLKALVEYTIQEFKFFQHQATAREVQKKLNFVSDSHTAEDSQ